MAVNSLKVNVYRINNNTVDATLFGFPSESILLRPVPADKIAFSNSLNVYGIIQYNNSQYWVKETLAELVTALNA